MSAPRRCLLWAKRTSEQLRPFRKVGSHARQSHPDFGELARLRIDLYRPTMPLHNDVVTDGEPEPGSLSGRLRCEERVEHLFFYFRWNTRAVIPNPDFHTIAQASGRGRQGRFIAISISLGSTPCCRIKAVRDQVQKHARDILRKDVGLPSGRVE